MNESSTGLSPYPQPYFNTYDDAGRLCHNRSQLYNLEHHHNVVIAEYNSRRQGREHALNRAIIRAGLPMTSLPTGEVAANFGYRITFALKLAFFGASFTLMSKYFRKIVITAAA